MITADDHTGPDPTGPSLVRPYLGDQPVPAPPAGVPAAPVRPPGASGLRPYLITGGRARPIDATLEVEAQVVVTAAGVAGMHRIAYEHRDILALCREPMAVAEVAARLGLHLGVARILVADLIAIGHLAVRRPDSGLHRNLKIIERVIRGLEAIH